MIDADDKVVEDSRSDARGSRGRIHESDLRIPVLEPCEADDAIKLPDPNLADPSHHPR